MHSGCGRYVLIYNGEIYNAPEMRSELEKRSVTFRGHSDTEVLLEACAYYGVKGAVNRSIGMFSFTLWDKLDRILYLARDRLGKKPLYWGNFSGHFMFGSELKALRAHPGWKPEIDCDALAGYMRYNYVAAPHTIYKGIYKLPPASILTVTHGREPVTETYWNMKEVVDAGIRNRIRHDDQDSILET
jgi:asparagine synthase (glutamine-hydrolysing)